MNDYTNFKKDILGKLDKEKYDNKILNEQRFNPSEKIELGRLLRWAEKLQMRTIVESILSFISKDFKAHFDERRAEKYIQVKTKITATMTARQNILLRSTFGIEAAPDKNSITVYEKKQVFMSDCMKGVKKEIIFSQNKRYPVFKKAVEELKQNYEKWDSLEENTEDEESLKKLIQYQHENLNKLSILLNELRINEADDTALKQLLPSENINKLLNPFMQGDRDASTTEIDDLKKEIEKSLLTSPKENPKDFSKTKLHQQRTDSPISTVSINKEAHLFDVIREGKAWAKSKESLTAKQGSANTVIPLKRTDGSEILAFYKEGRGSEKASGVMEKLMWDIAVIMKLEDSFAPTKEIDLRTKKELSGGTEQVVEIDKNGEIIRVKDAQKARQGGAQLALKGKTLLDNLLSPKPIHINKNQVIEGTLTTLVFGMSDAHPANIIISEKGDCQFFDNTRSMVHSNDFIQFGEAIFPSYRSGLLFLDKSYEKLSQKELSIIKNRLTQSTKKMEDLDKFLNHPQTKAQLQKLPTLWMNVDEALAAMKERIDFMQKALESNKIDCLRDLVFAANPSFKFAAIIHLLGSSPKINAGILDPTDKGKLLATQKILLASVGTQELSDLLENCVKRGFDPQKIKDWCNNPSLSFEKVISLATHYKPNPSDTNLVNSEKVFNEIKKEAKLDLKDINRGKVKEFLTKNFIQACQKNGIEIYPKSLDLNKLKDAFKPGGYFFINNVTNFEICFKNWEGEIKQEVIDVDCIPGNIKLTNKLYNIKDLNKVCRNRI